MVNQLDNPQQRKEKFCLWIAKGKSPTYAAKKAGVSRTQAYAWRDEDPLFDAMWRDAQEQYYDMLEDVAVKRATKGVLAKKVRDDSGKVLEEIRTYSDRLLELMLKTKRPREFRNDVPIVQNITVQPIEKLTAQMQRLGLPAPQVTTDYAILEGEDAADTDSKD